MPHHIIALGIVRRVKPHQLIAALMHREGMGPHPLAKKLGIPGLQGQIHRYSKGETKQPAPSTVAPLAKHFGLPLEAFYDEKVATAIAKERGITALPERPPKAATTPKAQPSGDGYSEWAAKAATMLDRVTDDSLRRLIYTSWMQTLDDMVAAANVGASSAEPLQAGSRPRRVRGAST